MGPQNKSALEISSYQRLKTQVQAALPRGRACAERLVDQEKARTYWSAGRLINQYIKKEKPEAERAKRFVEAAVKKSPFIIVTTTKPDKFDRYLSDV